MRTRRSATAILWRGRVQFVKKSALWGPGRPPYMMNAPSAGGPTVTDQSREPRRLLPSLAPFYRAVIPLAWPLVRIGVGWNLAVHGWGKVLRGPAGQAALLVKDGYPFGESFALLLIFIELIGGICIALGLFTRFFAAAVRSEE